MSAKQKILKVIRDSGPELTIEQAIYKLEVLRKIEIGMAQIERGETIPHEEIEARWLNDRKKARDPLDSPGKRRSRNAPSANRKRKSLPKNG